MGHYVRAPSPWTTSGSLVVNIIHATGSFLFKIFSFYLLIYIYILGYCRSLIYFFINHFRPCRPHQNPSLHERKALIDKKKKWGKNDLPTYP